MIIKKNIYNFFFVIFIFLFDRITKYFIISSKNLNDNINYEITSFLSFNLIWNEGIAFGLFSFEKKIYYNSLTILIILISLVIFWMIIKTKGLEKIGFMMVLGGSLGNIFDRIYYGQVPDFIDLHYNNFNWFIFNVADIFISFGVILLIYLEIFFKKKR